MSEKSRMMSRLSDEYLGKILGFAIQRTKDREHAEDLAQEIYLQVLTALARTKEVQNFNAFVWAISHNTYCKWVSSQRRGTTTMLIGTEEAPDSIEEFYVEKEQRAKLRQEIAFLAKTYRDVYHYALF